MPLLLGLKHNFEDTEVFSYLRDISDLDFEIISLDVRPREPFAFCDLLWSEVRMSREQFWSCLWVWRLEGEILVLKMR